MYIDVLFSLKLNIWRVLPLFELSHFHWKNVIPCFHPALVDRYVFIYCFSCIFCQHIFVWILIYLLRSLQTHGISSLNFSTLLHGDMLRYALLYKTNNFICLTSRFISTRSQNWHDAKFLCPRPERSAGGI